MKKKYPSILTEWISFELSSLGPLKPFGPFFLGVFGVVSSSGRPSPECPGTIQQLRQSPDTIAFHPLPEYFHYCSNERR
jgi:hypothetical protein